MRGKVKKDIKTDYFNWLYDKVDGQGYMHLLDELYGTTFKWFVPNDDNRAFEGLDLRDEFIDAHKYYDPTVSIADGCTMLEVLIGLARRCESIADSSNMTMRDWFWKLIDNLGLSECTDSGFLRNWDEYVVDKKLDYLIGRKYDRNGEGGLFPLKHSKNDQRKVELWYQMSEYLVENYF